MKKDKKLIMFNVSLLNGDQAVIHAKNYTDALGQALELAATQKTKVLRIE